MITEQTLRCELKYIHEASIPLDMATYAINTKIIPKIIYPLQVAVVPIGTIESWDRKIKAALSKAGKLPSHLPQNMYYLSKADGGIGLSSLQSLCEEHRIKLGLQLRNDWVNDTTPTTQAEVIHQAIERFNKNPEKEQAKGRVTICADTDRILRKHNMMITQTPNIHRLQTAKTQDTKEALSTSLLKGKRKYTDGSLTPNPDRAGWGLVEYSRNPNTPSKMKGGRLRGLQDNYKAESKALLMALIEQHPQADTEIYIDNHAVVKRWEKDCTNNPRARSTNPSRAIWSRIDNMKKIRSEAGGKTIVQWVRAHIEEQTDKPKKDHKPKQSKKESSKSKQQKAETQDPKGKPKPTHRQPRKHNPPPPPTCACGQPKGKCEEPPTPHRE